MTRKITYLRGSVIDEDMECSLRDICGICNIPAEIVQDMVDEGLICPRGSGPMEWRFSAVEIRRIQVSIRLQRDLRVNLPGCALILDLMEELEELRRLIRTR
jgi:chaperone modulatory protein CbpM